MIDDYRWRYAIVAQRRTIEECEQKLLRVMVEQGLTLRQIVAIYRALWSMLDVDESREMI